MIVYSGVLLLLNRDIKNCCMKKPLIYLMTAVVLFTTNSIFARHPGNKIQKVITNNFSGFNDAADFGFLPTNNGISNTKALQGVVDKGGTIVISKVGTYKLSGTIYIGDNTSLIFGNGVVVQKSAEKGKFGYFFK